MASRHGSLLRSSSRRLVTESTLSSMAQQAGIVARVVPERCQIMIATHGAGGVRRAREETPTVWLHAGALRRDVVWEAVMKRSKTRILNPRDTVLIAALTLFLSACISDGSPSPPLAAKVTPTTTAGNGTNVARLQETVSPSAALCPVTRPPDPTATASPWPLHQSAWSKGEYLAHPPCLRLCIANESRPMP